VPGGGQRQGRLRQAGGGRIVNECSPDVLLRGPVRACSGRRNDLDPRSCCSERGCGIRTHGDGVSATAVFKTRSATLLTCGDSVAARTLGTYSAQPHERHQSGCARAMLIPAQNRAQLAAIRPRRIRPPSLRRARATRGHGTNVRSDLRTPLRPDYSQVPPACMHRRLRG
jgi:hypothetical protein